MTLANSVSSEDSLPVHKQLFSSCPHAAKDAKELFRISFVRAPIPLMRAPP